MKSVRPIILVHGGAGPRAMTSPQGAYLRAALPQVRHVPPTATGAAARVSNSRMPGTARMGPIEMTGFDGPSGRSVDGGRAS